jgi:hypothetical protein
MGWIVYGYEAPKGYDVAMLNADGGDYDFVEGTKKLGAKQHLCCTESYLKTLSHMIFST